MQCLRCAADMDACTLEGHAGAPLTMRHADEQRTAGVVDPSLPLRLAQARREVESAFQSQGHQTVWLEDASSAGLVGAGLAAVARWLTKPNG